MGAYWTGGTLVAVQRDEAGRRVCTQLRAEHACFLHRSHVTDELRRTLKSSRHVVGLCDEGEWVRVRWVGRDILRRACAKGGWFEQQEIPTFEGDVSPVRRWMIDTGAEVAKPRRAYLDIETDSRVPFSSKLSARILCWALVDGVTGEVMSSVLETDTDDAERRLLVELWQALEAYDQVLAWSGDSFDFPVVQARTERRGIAVETRRWLWLDHLVLYRRMNMSAAESGAEKQSMSLGAVSAAVLGEAKLVDLGELGGETSWAMWEAGDAVVAMPDGTRVTSREKLRLYCVDDAAKMRRIEEKTGYVELLQTLCEATAVFPDTRGIGPKEQVESFVMRLGLTRGLHFPTIQWVDDNAEGSETAETFRGAFVLPSQRGILRDVHVADFSRMYPSIILSWNMSRETWQPGVVLRESSTSRPVYLSHLPLKEYPIPEGCCAAATDAVFVNEPQGVLALAVAEMLRLRAEWDARKAACPPGTAEWKEADRRSSAYKIASNSVFGVAGSPFSRLYERAIGEAITQTGAWLLKQTIAEAESQRWNLHTVAGDTDSGFFVGCSDDFFRAFVKSCNEDLYPRLLAERKCARNHVKLAYEKKFDRLVSVAMKRYAGRYAHFKGTPANEDSKPEIKGLEFKRGDTAKLARELQAEVVDLLLGGGILRKRVERCEEDPAVFAQLLDRWKTRVLEGELALPDFVMSKRLSKPVREYARKTKLDGSFAAQPVHVEIARLLQERGRDVTPGVRIEYVVVDGKASPQKCIPAEDFAGEFDRFYLWEELVYPPTLRVLQAAFPGEDWSRWERVRPKPAPKVAEPKAKRATKSQMGLGF